MSFRDKCKLCAQRLLSDMRDEHRPQRPEYNDGRLCTVCHVFDREDRDTERIPRVQEINPLDYL